MMHDAAGIVRWMMHDAAGIARIADHDAAGIGRASIRIAWVGRGATPVLARHGPFMASCHRRDIIGR
jgi:hypothetical protein